MRSKGLGRLSVTVIGSSLLGSLPIETWHAATVPKI
jgi:hypothetical protein